MKVFLFGKNGMLGNTVFIYLSRFYSTIGFARNDLNPLQHSSDDILALLQKNHFEKGDIVINCLGLIPQRKNTNDLDYFILNSRFPHQLANVVNHLQGRLLHISTNCVFESNETARDESCFPDAKDVYGLSKWLGEPLTCSVLRTSILGEEKHTAVSLLSWALSQKETVNGYTNHIWNGVSCLEVAKYLHYIIETNLYWRGVRHFFSPETVSKKELLELIYSVYKKPISVVPMETEKPVKKVLTSLYKLFIEIPTLEQQLLEQKAFFESISKSSILHPIQVSPEEYKNAQPFPHFLQDSFLEESFAIQLQNEILSLPPEEFDRYENPFESKYTLRNKFTFPPNLKQLFNELQSEAFLLQISKLCGYPLQLDTERMYWGVHIYDSQDKLDIHVDAGIHPILQLKKHCTLGIYLSKNYTEGQGCELELWKGTSCLQSPVLEEKAVSIAPLFNRMIFFTCTDTAWHGNPTPLLSDGTTKRIFLTISYLSDDTTLTNTYKKAYFIKRPEDPEDIEKDKLRALRANPETCTSIYKLN